MLSILDSANMLSLQYLGTVIIIYNFIKIFVVLMKISFFAETIVFADALASNLTVALWCIDNAILDRSKGISCFLNAFKIFNK